MKLIRIVDGASGEPVANLSLGLERTAADRSKSMSGGLFSSDNQGKFKIEGLSPAKYEIFIEAESNQYETLLRLTPPVCTKASP